MTEKTVKVTYDAEADAVYISLTADGVGRADIATYTTNAEGLAIDHDQEGHIVGIEILGAAELVPGLTGT